MAAQGFLGFSPEKSQLLISILGGLGSALSSGEPVGPALINPVLQTMTARNTKNLAQQTAQQMQQGGQYDQLVQAVSEAGGSLKVDAAGTKIDLPSAGVGQTKGTPGVYDPAADPQAGLLQSLIQMLGGGAEERVKASNINPPSGQSDEDGSLVGLDPTTVLGAMTYGQQERALQTKQLQDALNLQIKEFENQPVYQDPKTGITFNRKQYIDWMKVQKESKPISYKEFEEINKAREENGIPTIDYDTYMQWYQSSTKYKDYVRVQENYYNKTGEVYDKTYDEWLKEQARAGAVNVNLSDYRGKLETSAEVKTESYFKSPDFIRDLEKDLNEDVMYNLLRSDTTPEGVEKLNNIRMSIMRSRLTTYYDQVSPKLQRNKQTGQIGFVVVKDGKVEMIPWPFN